LTCYNIRNHYTKSTNIIVVIRILFPILSSSLTKNTKLTTAIKIATLSPIPAIVFLIIKKRIGTRRPKKKIIILIMIFFNEYSKPPHFHYVLYK